MEQITTQQPLSFDAAPRQEHEWLRQLVGEWTYETGALAQPGQPQQTFTGTETVRAFGELWIVAEGVGESPTGREERTMMTLGYDPTQRRFVGTWVGTAMSYLWVYEGELDASRKVLTLRCEGPQMDGEGGTTAYEDIIELEDENHRLLRARMLRGDGEWQDLMQVRYRRTG